MPIPQTIPPNPTTEHLCSIAQRWGITYSLAVSLATMAGQLPFGIQIISGSRTKASQDELTRQGRPTAAWDRTTHADAEPDGCLRLATGADLMPLVAAVPMVKAHLGTAAVFSGLRWGGGSSIDPETGIPSDWNHVDQGPR